MSERQHMTCTCGVTETSLPHERCKAEPRNNENKLRWRQGGQKIQGELYRICSHICIPLPHGDIAAVVAAVGRLGDALYIAPRVKNRR